MRLWFLWSVGKSLFNRNRKGPKEQREEQPNYENANYGKLGNERIFSIERKIQKISPVLCARVINDVCETGDDDNDVRKRRRLTHIHLPSIYNSTIQWIFASSLISNIQVGWAIGMGRKRDPFNVNFRQSITFADRLMNGGDGDGGGDDGGRGQPTTPFNIEAINSWIVPR